MQMSLSKKTMILIVAFTALLFTILLSIQFIWIKKSFSVYNQQFSNKMLVVRDRIYKAVKKDTSITKFSLPGNPVVDLFKNNPDVKPLSIAIANMLDSVFKSQDIYAECQVAGRIGSDCYIHHFKNEMGHNADLDKCDYKICLCNYERQPMLDIGFRFPNLKKYMVADTSWLIIPSFILIILLLGLFILIIAIINKQKTLAELKNDFINNLTHEFNTPIFSIGLTSKLLLQSGEISGSTRLKNYVELINTEKNRLQTQVEKMLQLTAIESGSVLMEKETVDIHLLLEKNIAAFTPLVDGKSGRLVYNPIATRHLVHGDAVHLFNTISNLLDNACKYSDKAPVIVVSTHDEGSNIVISVQDNGIGISDTAVKMIFDKFFRVKHGNRHDVKGFGLGLSYVKKIVEMHDGAIKVKSRPGEGTTFTITLPTKQ